MPRRRVPPTLLTALMVTLGLKLLSIVVSFVAASLSDGRKATWAPGGLLTERRRYDQSHTLHTECASNEASTC